MAEPCRARKFLYQLAGSRYKALPFRFFFEIGRKSPQALWISRESYTSSTFYSVDQSRTGRTRFRRSALVTTSTEEAAMAAEASIGDSSGPFHNVSSPAATGIRATL